MKLYGTVESERASKGQGGNKFLDFRASVDEKNAPTEKYYARITAETFELWHNDKHEMTIHHAPRTKTDAEIGKAFLESEQAKDISEERKTLYHKAWGVDKQ